MLEKGRCGRPVRVQVWPARGEFESRTGTAGKPAGRGRLAIPGPLGWPHRSRWAGAPYAAVHDARRGCGPLSHRPRGVVRARGCTDALAAGRAHDTGADPGGLRSRDCPRLGLRPGLHPSRRGCPPARTPRRGSALPRRIPRARPSRFEQRGDGVGRAAPGSPAAFANQGPTSDRHGLELCPASRLERDAARSGFGRNRRGVGPSACRQPPHGRPRFG